MTPRDVLDMLLIGAIWGGAFPMLRVAAPAFGPVALIGVLWGAALLGEPLTGMLLLGSAVVLVGTALAMGLVRRPSRARP
ncbi:MAG: hypothetical protein IT481_00560 [Gammaproteobacteria bacterium]|nr:hypothetical protein [Gammaproteobacteria bacterium]